MVPPPPPQHPTPQEQHNQDQVQPQPQQPPALSQPQPQLQQPHQSPARQVPPQLTTSQPQPPDMDLGPSSERLSTSPPGSYTRVPPKAINPTSVPPILPPHLLQVILNNPDKSSTTILPQPNHVMLNHLYALSIKDGIMVLSATHRFRKKYVTTLLYKPI